MKHIIFPKPPPLPLSAEGDAISFTRIHEPIRSIKSALCMVLGLGLGVCLPAQSATQVPITGEIERITLNDATDHWSGGTMVVGGQNIIIPRNLLIDLPANRLTLTQIFDQAPAACIANAETGLAKADTCNTSGVGGFASISANRTNAGNIIAGDVLLEKGVESLSGVVTYIDYNDGYFVLNGLPGDPNTGVIVRINDPDGRHTVQQGRGCAVGGLNNCSADPRFTLDPDNYTNVYTTGYPLCIPSTVSRTFVDVLGLGVTTAQANPDGSGDVLCPLSNRPANPVNTPVDDSRRFAPIQLGDSITADGNFETIGGVRFLSAHTTVVAVALATKNDASQPDYLFLDEVFIDAAPFENQRARALFIGFATLAPVLPSGLSGIDVDFWSIHYDPVTNAPHEFPLASVQGCENAAGFATCGAQGLVGAGKNIFRIRYDLDFILASPPPLGSNQAAKPRLSTCSQLRNSPRFAALDICPGAKTDSNGDGTSSLAEEIAILSPTPHEIQARTGHSGLGLITLDINGNEATCCQYLFPFGVNLGGIEFQEFVEIDLNATSKAFPFSGIPWNLDRRLSPNGCIDTSVPPDGIVDCEATPQPLDPFPYEGYEPRNQVPGAPTGAYSDVNYTNSVLTDASNRVFSFVDAALNNFDGNNTLLAWPPVDPPLQSIIPTNHVVLMCAIDPGPDSDADGVPDALDNCINVPNGPLLPDAGLHVQLDTNGDGYGNACDPDLNNDGIVDMNDANLFIANFGEPLAASIGLDADLNGDHSVNGLDVGLFSGFLSAGVPGPSGLVP